MITEVDKYRGWEISFDTEKETFLAYSSEYDREQIKKSYSAVKKFIDDFIKENAKFNPVEVHYSPKNYGSSKLGKFKIIGIRLDGRFIAEKSSGEKFQISDYDLKDIIIYQEENLKIIEKWKEMEDKASKLMVEAKKYLDENLKVKTLKEYKAELKAQGLLAQ